MQLNLHEIPQAADHQLQQEVPRRRLGYGSLSSIARAKNHASTPMQSPITANLSTHTTVALVFLSGMQLRRCDARTFNARAGAGGEAGACETCVVAAVRLYDSGGEGMLGF